MTTHSKLSPSSAHRWMLCPGSVREEAKYPNDNRSSPASIDGTHSHTLLEHCIKADMGDPANMIGVTLSDHDGKFTIDTDRADRVRVAIDYIKEAQADRKPATVRAECRVNPEPLLGHPQMSGTSDVIIISGSGIEIIDYKDGIMPVAAKDNPQMEIYGFGVLAEYLTDGKPPKGITTVTLTIIQPKLALKGMPTISSHDIPIEEFMAKAFAYTMGAAATEDPDAPLTPGDKQCHWCAAKGNCKAFADHSIEAVNLDVLDTVGSAAESDPNDMSDAQIREIIDAAPLLRSLLEAVSKEALRRFEIGKPIEGLKAVKGRGSRNWNLDDSDMADRLGKMGVPKTDRYVTKLVSPAQAEKLSWKAKSKGEEVIKKLTARQLKTLESEYIKKSEGKLTVVPDSDDRKAVMTDASSLFKPVNDSSSVDVPDWMRAGS